MTILGEQGLLLSPPIWVDFMDLRGRLIGLDEPGTQRDLERWGIDLHEGMRIVCYSWDGTDQLESDDLIAVVTVLDNLGATGLVGSVEWGEATHFSELSLPERAAYSRFRPHADLG